MKVNNKIKAMLKSDITFIDVFSIKPRNLIYLSIEKPLYRKFNTEVASFMS